MMAGWGSSRWWIPASATAALLATVAAAAPPCDDPDADPWIGEISQVVLSSDALAGFAVETFGAPVACEGVVTSRFDDRPFGTLTLRFAEGETFTFETMPPRVTIATLRSPEGFGRPDEVLEAFRDYAAGLGLSIVWDNPSVRSDGIEATEQFWDPDPGLNASASVVRIKDDLVEVRLSKAP